MKIKHFYEACRAVDINPKLVVSYLTDPQTRTSNVFDAKAVIKRMMNPYEVLDYISWSETKEGDGYWSAAQDRLEASSILSRAGDIIEDYAIERAGDDWHVGCQNITKKQRLKLFKLLAEDLGYELQ